VAEEWAEIRGILQETDPALELVRVVPPTADGLGEALAGVRGGVFHFTGHGNWDGRTTSLLFEQPSGAADPVEAGRVADLLRGRVSLAVLSACLSATPGEHPEANLAALLCAQGVPFVLGMQFTVPDVSARQFVARFYHYLFRGETVLEAVRQGRMAVLNDPALPMETRRLVFGTPVLYVQGPRLPEFSLPEGRGLRVVEPAPRVDLSGLPVPEGGFFGRHRELVQIGERLVARHGAQRSAAVVTLYGTGGIGKTALLRRAAERFAWAFDGVLAVPLDPLPTRASVLGRMEGFLGLPEDPRLDPERRQERVADALARQRVLLALDNFETLTRAGDAGDADARALYRFLSGLPARGVAFLVSSRERTGLPGEVRVEVPGLDERAGAQVFRQWVSARRGALTEEGMWALVRRVGGHPLALRLLARRFDEEACSLREFVEALEAVLPEAAERWDEGRRHDTLRACFGFSLGPLAEREPALAEALARLTVFSGPFIDQLAAPVLFGAERVSEASEGEQEALFRQAAGALHRLWDRGLIEREEVPLGPRVEETLHLYSVHPALAPFAREHLGAAARAEAEEGFFRAMQVLAVQCWPLSEGGGVHASPLLAWLAYRALPDLRRAARMREDGEGALARYHVGFLLQHFGDLEGAMGLLRESLAIDESLGDLRGKSATLHNLAYIHQVRGDLEGAMGLYRESLAIKESLGDLRGKSATLHNLAYIHQVRGDLEGAMGLYRESLAIKESLGDLRGKSATLHNLAYIHQVRGDLEGAMGLYRESLAIKESLGDLRGKSATLHNLAYIHQVRGDLEGAMGLYRESLAIKESLGDLRGKSATLHNLAYIHQVRGDLEGAMGLYRESLAIKESLGDLQGKAATLAMMGQVWLAQGEALEGLRALRQALEILAGMGARADAEQVAGILVQVRQEMGPEVFDALWAMAGGSAPPVRALSVEEWIRESVRAAREGGPGREELRALAEGMAGAGGAPEELRALARVLLQILDGNFQPDLSGLPEEWAGWVRAAVGAG
jgi:tetratricopeptide (TPR) repeat protein